MTLDADPSEVPAGIRLPFERFIHSELPRSRPDINAVLHVHPCSTWLASISGIPLRPVMGSFDPGAMATAVDRVPMYPHSWLIRSAERGREVADLIESSNACILLGHGIVTVGATVEEATVRAIKVDTIARASVLARLAGSDFVIDETDICELLPVSGTATGDREVWLHYDRLASTGSTVKSGFPFELGL